MFRVPSTAERHHRPELDVLAALRRSGPPYELSPGALAAAMMMMSSGGTTARLDRLERDGRVRRSPDPGDRRGVLVALTDQGRRLVDAAHADVSMRQHRPCVVGMDQCRHGRCDMWLRPRGRDALAQAVSAWRSRRD